MIQNTGAGTALSLVGGAGAPAFKVNSATKIGNLNADLLDGFDSAALQKRVTGTCARRPGDQGRERKRQRLLPGGRRSGRVLEPER